MRIVAATNRDLEAEVAKGRFREDLYYRLNVIPLHLPPLRERGDDILLLTQAFLARFCEKKNRPMLQLEDTAARVLLAYPWPGNVRELENFMERLSILVDGDIIGVEDLPRKILDAVSMDNLPELHAFMDVASSASAEKAKSSGQNFVPRRAGDSFVLPTIADMQGKSLRDFIDMLEDTLMDEALVMADGVKNQAAEILGMKRTTFIEKMRKRKGFEE